MKKMTGRRIHALLLAVSMVICMFGFDCRAKASETGQQMDEAGKLAVPQNVREEDGFIVWDEVEDAYGYTIQAGKGGETWEYNWYENKIEWSRFIYEHCSLPDFGDYAFKVCAFDETGEATEFSSPVTVSYQATLSMLENVKVSESDNRQLTWDEVEGAVRYNIRVYKKDESHSLYTSDHRSYNSYWFWGDEGEYLVTVQAMDKDYHVSEWTEEVMVKVVVQPRLATPQNVRFDESGENIIWDDVEGADYYYVGTGFDYSVRCEQPMLENWKRYISPWYSEYDGKQFIYVYAGSNSNNIESSGWSDALRFEYMPDRDESITVPQIKLEDDRITWDEADNAFRYECRIKINGENYNRRGYEKDYTRIFWIDRYPEGDYEIELCVIDEEGKYNSKIYPITLDTAHDERVWVPKLYHKFETILWDYDRLRHPDTSNFWVRIRRQRDGAVVKLQEQYNEYYYGLMDLKNGDYTIDACARQYVDNDYKLGNWSESMNIEKHEDGLFEEENETTTEVETPPEATDIPEEDRIKSITINPAFNMKNKDGNDVELDLSKIKIKAKEIYDEEGLKRAEEALGETLNGNKHYNLLDLTLLYDGKDFSNGYDGLVKVIIPLPKGHRDKIFSCYRLTETDGKVTKEIIPGEQTEDSYIIYLEHFSEYALVAAGAEDPHTHVYSTDWESDVTGHWKECSCKDRAEESVHTQDEGTVTKEATKTEPGIKTYKCSVCGYVIKTEEIPKLPAEDPHIHVYGMDWESDATGHWKECSCKDRAEESAHTQDAGTVTKEATKTEPGIKTYKCTVCEYVIKTEEIPKLPAEDPHTHVYSTDWKSDATGHWKECDCKDKAEESAHTQDAGTVTKEATKTEPGIKTYKCSVCGYVIKTEEIPKLPAEDPHTHVYSTDWKSDATGHWKECDCKEQAEESAHTQDEGTVTKEATKTEPGIKTYKCSVCEYVIKTEEIPKLPAEEDPHTHVYSTDWKSDATGHWKECDCKDKAEESAHTQDTGTVTKEATKTEPGIKTYKCSVCGYVIKTEEIAKLPADEEPINEKIPVATKVTKEQKKKNEIIINKNISFKITGNSLSVAWNKLSGADGYDIYAALCDDDFKGVTVSVGKAKSSATIRKINGGKISGKKTYKVKVKAYILSDGKKQYVGTSAVMHVTGSLNKTTTNAKKISLKKKAYSLKKGKSAQIRATIVKADKKKKLLSKDHGPKLSYVSSDETIATVTSAGKIKAKKRGKCTIYVRALNGVSKKINVTVK